MTRNIPKMDKLIDIGLVIVTIIILGLVFYFYE